MKDCQGRIPLRYGLDQRDLLARANRAVEVRRQPRTDKTRKRSVRKLAPGDQPPRRCIRLRPGYVPNMEKTPTACIRRRLWTELRMTRDSKEQARSTALALIGQYESDAEVIAIMRAAEYADDGDVEALASWDDIL